jgi:transposase-like protein|tara:strand:+ start:14514 stop:14723 length:210 start_codon:yes stop_codon:yes gene_type:complete
MKRSRYSEEQIIGILAEHETGAKCADLCRKHGMSEGTFYAWKAKLGMADGRRDAEGGTGEGRADLGDIS